MANESHVARLKQGVKKWNAWRARDKFASPDLAGAELFNQDLTGINLSYAGLSGADIRYARLNRANLANSDLDEADLDNAYLIDANLSDANLNNANLRAAKLSGASFDSADLSECELGDADLSEANLTRAKLLGCSLQGTDLVNAKLIDADIGIAHFYLAEVKGADFSGARLFETSFVDVDLSGALGLETCEHDGPSTLDHRTLQRSGRLPLPFLRGVGLPERLIEYLPSIFSEPIQHYSCFISYSAKDQGFSERLHADLQNRGIRCWFAPHDMPIGGKIWDEIDAAIRVRDKVLLILSKNSIQSDWVEDEVTKAFEEERIRKRTVLFPIRLDDAVKHTNEAWAAKLRARHIGDFRRWKEHDEYQKSFARVLRDLTVKKE
jgi:uncharacterized protein YjbI with pentapeptide repeats